MSGHTPGPWRACNEGNCSCKVVGWKDHPVAKVYSGEWGDEFPSIRLVGGSLELKAEPYMERFAYGSIPEEEAKANALLIAAAPELLTELRESRTFIQNGIEMGFIRMPDDPTDPANGTLERIIEAIAKAEGTR